MVLTYNLDHSRFLSTDPIVWTDVR